MSQKAFKKNIISTILVRFLRLLVGFGGTYLLARWLKPAGMGQLSVFLALPMILSSLGEMGIRQSIAYCIGQEKYSIKEIVDSVLFLWLITSSVSFFIILLIYYFQGLFEYGWLFCVLGALIVPANLILRFASGIAMGKQYIGYINLAEIWTMLIRLGLIVLLVVYLGIAVKGALIMNILSMLIPGFLILGWIIKELKIVPGLLFNKGILAHLVSHGFKYAISLFLISMNYRINILILQHYVNDDHIGYFSLGVRLAELIWILPASVGMVIFSHSTSVDKSDKFSLKVIKVLQMNFIVCALGAIVLAVICPYFIGFVFGEEYLPAVPAIRWMLPGIVVMTIFKILHADLAGNGKPLAGLQAFILALAINIALNLLLVEKYGVVGSSIAASASYIVGAIMLLYIYSSERSISIRTMLTLKR